MSNAYKSLACHHIQVKGYDSVTGFSVTPFCFRHKSLRKSSKSFKLTWFKFVWSFEKNPVTFFGSLTDEKSFPVQLMDEKQTPCHSLEYEVT